MTPRYKELETAYETALEDLAAGVAPDAYEDKVQQIRRIEDEMVRIEDHEQRRREPRDPLLEGDRASAAIASRKSIEEYGIEELNAIARALNAPDDETEFEAMQRDMLGAMMRLAEVPDTVTPHDPDEPEVFSFVQAEIAQAMCHMAYFNGRRTRQKLESAVRGVRHRLRESTGNDVEIDRIETANNTIRGLQQRLVFWRAAYKAAQEVHARVAALIDQPWMSSRWQTPEERGSAAAARKVTASAAEALAYAAAWTGYVPVPEEQLGQAKRTIDDPHLYEPPFGG